MIIPKPKIIHKHAVGCIITYKQKYLLFHRTKDNFWNSISGLPKLNESLKNAIIREIKEETGLKVNPKFFKTIYHKYKDENVAYHLFTCNLKEDPTDNIKLNKESKDFGLFTLNQALKLNLFEDEDYCLKLHYKITNTLIYINRKGENYSIPFFTKIIKIYTKDEELRENAEFLIRTALRGANFLDLYYETQDDDYLYEAIKYKNILYANVNQNDKRELEHIEKKIINFFDYEKQIWNKAKSEEVILDKEIERFMRMKSSDAIFYARIIKIFTKDRDFTLPLYTNMQLLDIMSDIQEYNKDFEKNSPNLLYIKLSQKVPRKQIPAKKEYAINLARKFNISANIMKIADGIIKDLKDFDFSGYKFIKDSIYKKYNTIKKELEIK